MTDDAASTTTATYRCTLLRAGRLRLDGGSMFGLVPRVVWSRTVPTDDKNRITLSHNCLLLEGGVPGEWRRVVIEVGTGDKLPAKMREIFDLEDRTVVDALQEAGCPPEQVDDVIVSHLHFDHAGALTRLPRAGETPQWIPPDGDDGGGGSAQAGGCLLTFPRATIHVQRREWEDALANRSVMTRTYYRDHLDPIRDRLQIVDSPIPFPSGYTPDRGELPRTALYNRETPVLPGISVFLVPGHTWGQQAIKFTDDRGRTIVFTPDVMPTAAHLGAAYSLAYDVEPYTSMITRQWFLAEAAEQDWVLCLDHEPGEPFFRVRRDGKGWFTLVPEPCSAASRQA